MTRPLTMADILAAKGKRQLVQLNVASPEQAAAAQSAGIDIIVNGEKDRWAAIRAAAPDTHLCLSLRYGDQAGPTELLRAAFEALRLGADSIYCPLGPRMIEPLAAEGVPVCAHAGYVPQKTRMTGLRAFGKTAEEAKSLYRRMKDFESAGATMLELEIVAAPVAALLAAETSMSVVSIGSGNGCDVTYLFAIDLLGEAGRLPRHARVFDDLSAEYVRLQDRRVKAFSAFRADVAGGSFPGPSELVTLRPAEAEALAAFLADPRKD